MAYPRRPDRDKQANICVRRYGGGNEPYGAAALMTEMSIVTDDGWTAA